MGLSSDLLSQFAKATKDNKRTKKETTAYGTVKEYDSKLYVQIDGSDLLTPASTTADMKNGERVIIQIKDHSATIIGNMSSPSVRTEDANLIKENVTTVSTLVANKVDTIDFETNNATVTGRFEANEADINKLKADVGTVENLEAVNAEIANLKATKLDTSTATITYATIESLNSTNATVEILRSEIANVENLEAVNARITNLETTKLNADDAAIIYANIDFSNIGMAAIEKVFSKSGIIKDLVVGNTSITGELVGVTIKGDLIQGNTIVADKLVVQGEDGLYYKLNTDGIKIEAQQTDYNSLNGSIITTKSITASKINVTDLVAFGATIGGFKLTENSIYSGVKTSATNTTTGVFFGSDGQMAVGGTNNFIKYYKDQNGNYKLEISADSMVLSSNNTNIETTINNLKEQVERISEYCNIDSN